MSAPIAPLTRPDRRPASTTAHMSGLVLCFVAAGMAVSAAVDVVMAGDAAAVLLVSAALSGAAGAVLWRGTRVPRRVSVTAAFVAVTSAWVSVSIAGAVPYFLAGVFAGFDEAVFEALSGFTGTGSTVLVPIEGTSPGLLFWRNLTQWYGGMGVIVLAVAVLPFLGVGGLELIKAEAPGPTSDRLAPRVRETAKRLWLLYLGFTALTCLALGLAGMSLFDAVTHAATAVSTGGFSPYDASIGHFDSLAIELVLIVVMVLGAISFALHWNAVVRGRAGAYWRSGELRFFLGVLAVAVLFVTALNVQAGTGLGRAIRDSAFSVVSIGTTTGYGTADFARWVPGAQVVLLLLMFSGAMTGSTSGAAKSLRLQVMVKVAQRELRRARRPHAMLAIRLGATVVPESIVARVIGFVLLYVVTASLGIVVLAVLGADVPLAASGTLATMGAIGPALGDAGPAGSFLAFTRPARGVLMVLMLLGRLELFAVLVTVAAAARRVRHPRRPS